MGFTETVCLYSGERRKISINATYSSSFLNPTRIHLLTEDKDDKENESDEEDASPVSVAAAVNSNAYQNRI